MEENKFIITNDDGEEVECDILFTYEDPATSKNYIVYTDNTEDDEGNTNVFASTFDPEKEDPIFYPIETAEEWEKIERILNELQQ